MKLTKYQLGLLKKLMIKSAREGNLVTSAICLENGKVITSQDSPVNTNHDATAHSERLLVERVCKMKGTAFDLGLTMVSVVESCMMCLSACAWAGFAEVYYIIPAERYLDRIPWMSELRGIDKRKIVDSFAWKLKWGHLKEYEEEFCEIFEKEMERDLG
jgi:tRNA(Arg) A34 adenosine deaminase TadA